MKKIVLVLTLVLSTTMAAHAFIDNQYMTTEQYMMNTGYSKEMAKMMAVTNRDPYREPDSLKKDTPMDVVKKVYNYIAPGMYTDYDFYNYNMKFNTIDWRDL